MEEKKYNILIVHNRYQIPGGEDTVMQQEADLLRSHGHHVFVYERNNAELKEMTPLQKAVLPFTVVYSFKTEKEVRSLIKEHHIDLVHVHNTILLVSPSVFDAARKEHVPVIQTLHNFRMICPNALLYRDGKVCTDCLQHGLNCAVKNRCYRGSRAETIALVLSMRFSRLRGIYRYPSYICLTEFNRNMLLKQGQISERQIFVKPNSTEDPGTPLSVSSRKNTVIFAGRLEEIKGIRFLLDVWKEMGKDAPELQMYGDGPLEPYCEEFLQQHQELPVRLFGRKLHKEVLEAMRNASAVILPTQVYEGFPMTLVEAFSCGTPAIVPDFGNAGALVQEEINGWHYKQNDAESLINVLHHRTDLIQSTYESFRKQYTSEQNYRKLMEIYQTVLRREESL